MSGAASVQRDTYTIKEVAQRLGIGLNQAYEAAKRGDFPSRTVGARILVPRVAFERWLDIGPKAT